MSIRGIQWQRFAERVSEHIEEYTVPQYGDYPDDNVSEWSAQDCVKQIEKYARRFGSNKRPGQERLDLLKIAHYAQIAAHKLEGSK